MRATFALTTAIAMATSLLLFPVSAAAGQPAVKSSGTGSGDAALGSCSALVAGSNFCTFGCVRERTVVVSFIGTGSVKGFCVGAAAACAALGSCSAQSFTRVTAAGTGICILSGAGLGACGT